MAGRRTPLYPQHIAAGARMVDFAGWDMPVQYRSVREEQEAVRTAAGLFDVSHMGRFQLRGEPAGEFLQGVVTNDVLRLAPGRAQYNLLCRPDGGIVDDLVVYRHEDGWTVVVNAANRDKDMAWLRDHAPGGVEIADRSEETSLLALQGPEAERRLPAEGVDLSSIPRFRIGRGVVAGVPSVIARTGYTGEDGFEIFVPSPGAGEVWTALLESGAVPCGLAARDVCRLEAGLRLYGSDMDEGTNPYEAGLGWTVKLGKGEFVGRKALRVVKAAGPDRMIAGLRCAERVIPRHGAPVSREGDPIGEVTSGTHSFFLGAGIGMASLAAGRAPVGTRVEVGGRGPGGAQVVKLPFYRGSVKTASAGGVRQAG